LFCHTSREQERGGGRMKNELKKEQKWEKTIGLKKAVKNIQPR
jgi:hypothetical protein